MKNIRDYIFYRVYEIATRKGRSVEDAVESSVYTVDMYYLLIVDILFFASKGIIEFDMSPLTLFYLAYKKLVVIGVIIFVLIWVYFMNKKYKKKVADGWIKELRTKYHKEKYSISAVWIIAFPFIMFLVVPIVYGLIKGTLQIVRKSTGEVIWGI